MIGRTNAAVGTVKNPYIAKSESEMAKYCDAKYAGTFVKFLDPAYNFSVPKTFTSRLYIPQAPQKMTEVLNFSFDWTRDREEVLSLVKEILSNHNSDKVKILHMTTTEFPKVLEFYVEKGFNPDNSDAYAIMFILPQGLENDSIPAGTPIWAYNIKVGCSIEPELVSMSEGALWSQEMIDRFYNTNNINGWGGVKLDDKLVEGLGIITYMLYALAGGATDKVITVTEYLPEATPLFMIADHSQLYKHDHIYQIIKSDEIVSKYIAASPLAIGDPLANATIKFNTNMNYDQVMNLMYQIPWNEGYISDGDGIMYYYCIFNNAPDMGYSSYTGGKFDESEQFWKGVAGIIFCKIVTDTYTDYGIVLRGENWVWVSDHEHFGGDVDGWQITQATIPTTIEGYNFTQDATITRINAQNIVNQLFSKTNFTILSSDFKYEAMRYNRDGHPTYFCSPVGNYIDVNIDEANKILQDNRNLGKIYRFSGASESGNYHVGDYYIVEEVTE